MSERQPLVSPRRRLYFEGGEADRAELCIRVMEPFLDAADDDPKLRKLEIGLDLWGLYADVLQEELGPRAFRLAYEIFSKEPLFDSKTSDAGETRRQTAE